MSTQKEMGWLKKQIIKLEQTDSNFKNEINKIKQIDPTIFNEFHLWTPLKLAFLNFTLDVCAIVANKKFKIKNYIDLFSGSGINRTKNRYGDILIGSPFLALLNHSNRFTNFFFCEENRIYYNTLSNRINSLQFKNCTLLNKDCNVGIDDVLFQIGKMEKSYNFFFIDPYALEFSWDTMKKILNIRSDILLTFMTRTIWRTIATEKATQNGHNKLNRFFGDTSWKKAKTEEDLVRIYEENILKGRGDARIISTQIRSKSGFLYDLIFITHKTKGGNPWLNPIQEAKQELEKHTDEAVKSLLHVITKRQGTLF